jgi:beta-lactamase class A
MLTLTRRQAVAATAAFLCSCTGASPRGTDSASTRLAAMRARLGGRLGVHALDTETGQRIGFDDESRFAMASTFKLMLAAAVLAEVERGRLDLEQTVAIGQADILPNAPVTSTYVTRGSIRIRELCAAVVEVSDNPGANLLLSLIGGPPGFTEFMRSLDDGVTRLDRTELELNTNLPGDVRDTTTPRAMVDSMERVLVGRRLGESSRTLLIDWLVAARTGLQRIRGGLPADWQAGDKTGTGANGAVNDLAIAWPPSGGPILFAIYMSESALSTDTLSAAHAEIAGLVATEFASRPR